MSERSYFTWADLRLAGLLGLCVGLAIGLLLGVLNAG